MNCMVATVADKLGVPKHEVYAGVGHGEPIHISEIVAWLLTRGYGAVPRYEPDPTLTQFKCLCEGIKANGEPHMGDDLVRVDIYWYLVPVKVNETFKRLHAAKRDRTFKA